MFRIDRIKWLAAVAEVEQDRGVGYPKRSEDLHNKRITWKEYQELGGWRDHSAELTKLYSIRSLGRGRVHRVVGKLTFDEASKYGAVTPQAPGVYAAFNAAGGTLRLALDEVFQEKYVGESWKSFERPAEPEAVTT